MLYFIAGELLFEYVWSIARGCENGVGEGLKTFGAMKIMFNVRSVSYSVKRSCLKEW